MENGLCQFVNVILKERCLETLIVSIKGLQKILKNNLRSVFFNDKVA